jgi:NitT/TauT family transport system substrate-binding protein
VEVEPSVVVELADCCVGEPDSRAPTLSVHQSRPLRLVSRRRAMFTSVFTIPSAVVTACSTAPLATPTTPARLTGESTPAPGPAATAVPTTTASEKLDLAFCSQILCILPYEVARRRGFWEAAGLDVNLVYMNGAAAAMNALLTNSLEFVGSTMDLAVQGAAKSKKPVMLVSTASQFFGALVAAPKSGINTLKDLSGKKIGVGSIGDTGYLTLQYLLKQAGVDPKSVEFVALGTNLYDRLLRGEVDAGGVQEPSLTLLQRAGWRVVYNLMNADDAKKYFGGGYQFMGLNTRQEVLTTKAETARKLIRGLVKANQWIRASPGSAIVKNVPGELVAGGDVELFAAIIDARKSDLYPADGLIREGDVQRVIDVQKESGVLTGAPSFKATDLFTNALNQG